MTTLNEKLTKRRQQIKDRSSAGAVFFPKEGTTRIRIRPAPDQVDWAVECTSFYLGQEVKGVFSAVTLGDDCPVMEKYEKLRDSKKSGDKDIAKLMTPRTKYLVAAVIYEENGKGIDVKNSEKMVQVPTGVYNAMLDFFLDPDMGDFTDAEEGYDLKIKRTGKGKQDTEYTLIPVQKSSPIPKDYSEEVDPLDVFTENVVLTYEEAEEKLAQFLVGVTDSADEDDDPAPRKKKRRRK